MGRRNIHATKTGKFMNPTDQARKMARKKELKKNKKQRMVVRQAVLKSKDVCQLLEEAAYYDKQEFDPSVKKTLNDRVIQEKRKKIMETVDRLINLYKREDMDYAMKITTSKNDYEAKRNELIIYYEQVKLAESVKTSEIPLPECLPDDNLTSVSQIPLPPMLPPGMSLPAVLMMNSQPAALQHFATKGILKNATNEPKSLIALPRRPPPDRAPPGPPPGPVPELSDSENDDMNTGNECEVTRKRIRFADDSEAPANTENVDQSLGRIHFRRDFPAEGLTNYMNDPGFMHSSSFPPLPNVSGPPELVPFQPSMALRPVGDSISHYSMQLPSDMSLNNISSTGILPQMSGSHRIPNPGAFLSAPPNLEQVSKINSFSSNSAYPTAAGVIEAKPKLKNLIGDATRLVPTSIRVRRSVKDTRGNIVVVGGGASKGKGETSAMYDPTYVIRSRQAATKDSAYEEFMKEIDGLM